MLKYEKDGKTLLRVRERRLLMANGVEGDKHDPYGWTEHTMVFNGNHITLRQSALGYNRLTVTNKTRQTPLIFCEDHAERENQSRAVQRFEAMTRLKVKEFERCYQRLNPPSPFDGHDPFYGHE